MANINNSIFKQYLGTLDQFKSYYEKLTGEQKTALDAAIVFIHDKPVNNAWNHDGYIFANGLYYTCRNVDAETLSNLIFTGDASGVRVSVVDVDIKDAEGNVIGTKQQVDIVPVIKEDLQALINVGFVENGKTWTAGTDIETILNDIFAKEVWYKADFAYAENLSVTIDKPTLTVTVDGSAAANSGTYEIGAPVVLTGSITNTSATGDKFTLTCASALNGFVTNGAAADLEDGDSATGITSLEVAATLSSSGSDSLSVSNLGGAFANAAVSNNAVSLSGESVVVKSGTNKITLTTTSKTYTLTANPSDDEKTLTTLSNKNKYYTETTKDDVTIKHTVSKTHSEAPTSNSSISFTGAYKYYYVWGVESLPTIPTDFSGDLEGWTENWGSKNVYGNNVKKSLSGYIYVLKPVNSKPGLLDGMANDVQASFVKSDTTYTNKYGTTYYLYSFHDFGPTDYQNFVL